jgi:RNA polymerase sigma-B factor
MFVMDSSSCLIVKNDALAIAVAKRFFHLCKGLDEADMVQIARMGLIRAARKYDPSRLNPYNCKPVAFSSFAVPYIRGEILHYLRDRGSLIKVSRKFKDQLAFVEREAIKQGRRKEAIAQEQGWDWPTLQEVAEIHVVCPPTDFFEESLAAEEEDAQSPSDQIIGLLAKLPSFKADIVLRHYYQGVSFAQIAAAIGQTEADVHTWHDEAIASLRQSPLKQDVIAA